MKPFYQHGGIEIWCGNCLEIMPRLEPPFDAIIADWPYGTTACSWDSVIPLEPLWKECKRLSDTAVLFGSQPFTTDLINSNREWFKYCWYWRKTKPNGWQHAKNKPMTAIEDVCVFSKLSIGHVNILGNRRMTYNPQGIKSVGKKKVTAVAHGKMMGARPNQVGREYEAFTDFPCNVLEFANVIGKNALHPTQKPKPLMACLIRTYTNPGDIILDNTMGSGTTLLAAQNEGRRAVGIELSEKYCKIAVKRLRQPSFFSIPEPAPKPQPRQVDLEEMIERGLE